MHFYTSPIWDFWYKAFVSNMLCLFVFSLICMAQFQMVLKWTSSILFGRETIICKQKEKTRLLNCVVEIVVVEHDKFQWITWQIMSTVDHPSYWAWSTLHSQRLCSHFNGYLKMIVAWLILKGWVFLHYLFNNIFPLYWLFCCHDLVDRSQSKQKCIRSVHLKYTPDRSGVYP